MWPDTASAGVVRGAHWVHPGLSELQILALILQSVFGSMRTGCVLWWFCAFTASGEMFRNIQLAARGDEWTFSVTSF